MVDKLRAETPFPAAGEGVALKFGNRACAVLQKRFGADWFTTAHIRMNNFDIEYMQACVEAGAVRDGKPAKVDFESIDVPLLDIGGPILDALYVCVHGMTFAEYLIEIGRQTEALENAENPTSLSSPENTSPI